MKQGICILLAVLLLLTAAGCTAHPAPEQPAAPDAPKQEHAESAASGEASSGEAEKQPEPGFEQFLQQPGTWHTSGQEDPPASQIIRTNGYRAGEAYPRVTVLNDAEALAAYCAEYESLYTLSGNDAFQTAIQGFDEQWFRTHQLVVVVLEETSGSVSHTVTSISNSPEPEIRISRNAPEIGTADMAQWHILIEAEKDYFSADAQIRIVFSKGSLHGILDQRPIIRPVP